jgi:hypothetical protein
MWLLSCFLFISGLLCAQTTAPPSISGTVTTNDGKTVTAFIQVTMITPTHGRPTGLTTAKDGSFHVSSLAPGTYELCAAAVGGGYLQHCLWDTSGLVVSVAAGKTSQVAIQLKKASTLKVHINDPSHFVQPSKGPKDGSPAQVMMGVFASGHRFYPLVQTASDGNGSDHQILVPFDKPFVFYLKPVGVTMADSSNAAVPSAGTSLTLTHNSTTPPGLAAPTTGPNATSLTFTVKGKP